MTIDWSTLDWADPPAWIAAVISLGAGAIALRALRHSRMSAEASTRSADASTESAESAKISAQAAVRQAAAAERQVELAEAALKLAEESAARSSSTTKTELVTESLTGPKPPYVAWWVEHQQNQGYRLRNIGTDTARNVEVDRSRIKCVFRGDFPVAELPPNASVKILLSPMLNATKPGELWVRWEGHPGWMAVPVP
ncbi:hypothetical protein [Plantactinospora endophytica]|uniref:Uncharacterized protein n=1 Tax=Plantactinospora endophytica TaxID=673535 RepID=A0ABQ4EF53_9ACTN|nr:hypothetical protein [Plantactinospora endophytica]GIG93348.1 hypothetical protein Pen02_82840 [Plantactinospora endophytica]